MLDSIFDAVIDGLKSVPILFIAYLLMELLENSETLSEKRILGLSHKTGPAIGGLLGIVPQCGISGAAASLFSTGSITVGTMMAVFFATSDEMLPILLSASVPVGLVLRIVITKALLGILLGYLSDLLLRKFFSGEKNIHSFCEQEHCACEENGNVFLAALKHTVKIALMLIAVGVILNLLFYFVGTDRISNLIITRPVIGEILIAFFGLIPNCTISVVITELYLSNVIGIGCLFSGLLANAGIGLLVLLRTNKSAKENGIIIAALFVLSAITGCLVGFVWGLL